MNGIFSIKSDSSNLSVYIDKNSGRWALSKEYSSELLSKIGKPFTVRPFTGINMLALNMGRECNFNCSYCLVQDLKNQTEKLHPDVGFATIEKIADLNCEHKHIVFHGSEPMLNFSLIKELVRYGNKLDSSIEFSVQSNGSLFNTSNLAFLKKYNVGVGISMDGLHIHQNEYRPFKNGLPSFNSVSKGIKHVKKYQEKISVIVVVTDSNVNDLFDIINYYERIGIDSILFNPVNPTQNFPNIPDQEILTANFIHLFEYFIERKLNNEKTIEIENVKRLLRLFFRPKTTSNCLQCGGGSKHPLLAVDVDGTIYPCDYFWGMKEYSIGNILTNSFDETFNSKNNFRVFPQII